MTEVKILVLKKGVDTVAGTINGQRISPADPEKWISNLWIYNTSYALGQRNGPNATLKVRKGSDRKNEFDN